MSAGLLLLLLLALWVRGGSPQATTFYPTAEPTLNIFPTARPSATPTIKGPTPQPTALPTSLPTAKPSARPSLKPPTASPTITPTLAPTASPTLAPTLLPTLAKPTGQPSGQPSRQPTRRPTGQPTRQPSRQPTTQPTRMPSGQPSKAPSRQPTAQPTRLPSGQPTRKPSRQPTGQPSRQPTGQPSRRPTGQPSRQPTGKPSRQPTGQPSRQPSRQPTGQPSRQPSGKPTAQPSVQPTSQPSRQPSRQPTGRPSRQPTGQPSRQPTGQPSRQPSRQPTGQPSRQPSRQPTGQPSRQPTSQPTREPTSPTGQPSRQPSRQPTGQPTSGPTRRPTPFVDYIHTRRFQTLDASTFSVYTSLWLSTHANWMLFYKSAAGLAEPPRAGAQGCPADSPLQYPVCMGGAPVDGKDGLMLNASYIFESLSGVADSVSCPKILCYEASSASSVAYRLDCLPTPSDTIEYLPPQAPYSDRNDSTLCLPLAAASVGGAPSADPWVAPPYYGFNQGVPPLYEPVPVVRLVLKGHIKASVDANTCSTVQGAVIEAWQLDASDSAPFDASTAHFQAAASGTSQAGASFPTVSGASLRGLSCRSQAKSDDRGGYQFNTTVPSSYGPPRHIVLRVTAPGFRPLLTRLYFANDFRLQQLTTWGSDYARFDAQNQGPNKFASRPGLKLTSVGTPNGSVWLDSFEETTDAAGADTILADSAIGRDPRVRTAEWVSLAKGTGYSSGGNGFPMGLEQGYFVVNFDVTLRPDRASDSPVVSVDGSVSSSSSSSALSSMPAAQLDGLWVAADGGLVRVQTHGNLFYASEYPGPRVWGSVLGNVFGNTIRGIDFSQPTSSSSSAFSPTLFLNVFARDSVGESVGSVLQQDSFVTAPLLPASASALTIAWSGGASPPGVWSRQSDVEAAGYRYFKLEISRQFSAAQSSNDGSGTVVINEIVLFDGVFSQREVPSRDLKMQSARTPAPLKVSCSSFRAQDQHCYKAFDGIAGSSSAWVSDGLPPSDGVRYQQFGVNRAPLWIVLDLGPGRGALPSALQIVCNAAVASSSSPSAGGCPRAFNLLGSMDNGHFDLLFHADLSQAQNVSVYGNSSADVPGSATFFIPWESSAGRPNNHRCGSCDQGPNFVCSTDSHDPSCFSRYCSAAGVCSEVPSCAPGEYLRQDTEGAGGPDFLCTPCPAGRYGASPGLTSPSCSGLCSAGYYCPPGSISPQERECGNVAFYCPVGSAAPVAAGAGRYTVALTTVDGDNSAPAVALSVDSGGNQVRSRTRTTDVACPLGHYCRGGVSIPCPAGTYGDRPGLQTPACSDSCISGEYCPSGSIAPTRCPKGYFCPDGLTRAMCPAGSFGAAAGLASARCSGLCKQGYFCPEGSTSATQQQCPGGRYGLTSGLPDSSCSGMCPAGFFCPPASTSATAFGCSTHLSPPLVCNKVTVKDAAGPRLVEVCTRGINDPTIVGPKKNSVVNFAALNYSSSSGGDIFNEPILAPQVNPLYYCPEGSAFPIEATYGFYTVGGDEGHRQAQAVCDLGYYCVDGVRRSCPAGSFGASSGLTGSVFIRPTAAPTHPPGIPSRYPTVTPTRIPTNRPVGAPTGQPTGRPTRKPTGQPSRQPSRQPTGQPSRVPTGQPSVRPTRLAMRKTMNPTGQPTRQPTRQPTGQPTRHPARPSLQPTGQPTRSPTGQPSSKPSNQPSSQPSLRPTGRPTVNINGTIDYQSLLSPVFCSGFCARGFFCPANSTSSRQSPCPPGKYGFTTGLTSPDCTADCPLGHYCPAGTADPIPCPAGTFGNATGLIDSTCNGDCSEGGCSPALCQEGYYCPAGSVSATQVACGGPGVYCPAGSAAPTVVSVGYHSIGPFPYENSQTRTAQAQCPPGSFCEGGVMRPCPVGRYGVTAGLANQSCSGLCRKGTYCPLGSWNESTLRCPAGRFGQTKGLWSSACSGECARGYHCPEGSTSSKELECGVATPAARSDLFFSKVASEDSGYLGDYGSSKEVPVTTGGSAYLAKNATKMVLDLPNSVFCPTGSAAPLKVLPGYYSVGGTRTTRWAQKVCPMGSYCVDGVVYDCPAGRYGVGDRLTTPDCTGPCAKGYYCPAASTTKNQNPCPVGRYGNSEGLTDSGCSGACKRPTDCPLASLFSTPPSTVIDSNVY